MTVRPPHSDNWPTGPMGIPHTTPWSLSPVCVLLRSAPPFRFTLVRRHAAIGNHRGIRLASRCRGGKTYPFQSPSQAHLPYRIDHPLGDKDIGGIDTIVDSQWTHNSTHEWTHIGTALWTCTSIHMHLHMCICMCTHIWMYTCLVMYVYMHACMHLCIYCVCMYVCMHACMHVYVCFQEES